MENSCTAGRPGAESRRGRLAASPGNTSPLTPAPRAPIRVGGGIFEFQAGGPAALAATLISNRCWREAASLSPSSPPPPLPPPTSPRSRNPRA
ncbi:hypothetical protein B5X24_HaOG206981 [Helicoverpa armigera]|nr:hypothetical protein B5X24_HaOG206981 [Helicoverpa armigera]